MRAGGGDLRGAGPQGAEGSRGVGVCVAFLVCFVSFGVGAMEFIGFGLHIPVHASLAYEQ